MALQIWCPFTSDTRQQGLSNISISITSNQGSIVTNGKLGKCLKTSSQSIDLNYTPDLNNKSLSIGGWFKFNKAEIQAIITSTANITEISTACIGNLIGNNAYGGFGLIYGTNNLYTSNKELSSIGVYPYIRTSTEAKTASSFSITFDTWYHIFAIWDNENRKLKLYINGVLYSSNSVGAFSDAVSRNLAFNSNWIGGGNGPGLSIPFYSNDVRVYDHALSPREIEILSRGLVCHYPLCNNGNGQANLLKNSNFTEGSSGSQGYNFSATWAKQTDCMKITSTSAAAGLYTANYDSVTTGDMATFSAYVKADASMTIYIGVDGSGIGNCESFTVGTSWQRISISKAKTTNNANLRVYGNGTFYVRHMKYELGSTVTPWCPNSADSIYSSMGYSDTTEYDVSGYGNNGTKQYITYETDTPRYSVSSVLSGSSTRIPNTTINIGNEWSYGLWFKSAAAARSWEGLVILNNSGGDTDIQLGFYTNPNSSQIQTTANGQYNMISHTYDGKWHHLFATFDGTTLKTYKDGELVNTKTITNNLLSRSNLTIGARRRGEVTFDCPYKGSLSDFRLYATALSAAQVAELYNTAVSVANNGTLMGYELVEV